MARMVLALAATLGLAAAPALAHTGGGAASGLAAGFAHPIGGLDHVLAMVAVGLLAVQQGGRALWLIPVAFLTMMAVGGGLGVAAVPVPLVEAGIVGSVILLGVVIAAGRRLPAALAMALVGLFAVFHGHAHGLEMPAAAASLDYGVGMLAATALLHAVGIGLGLAVRPVGRGLAPRAVRLCGCVIALGGVALLA